MKVKGYPWVGIGTADFESTLRFFTEVLGLPVLLKGDDVAHLGVGDGAMLEIFGPAQPSSKVYRTPTVGFAVEDLALARAELLAAGVELVGEAGSWNGNSWQCFRGPDGNLFEIKQLARDTSNRDS